MTVRWQPSGTHEAYAGKQERANQRPRPGPSVWLWCVASLVFPWCWWRRNAADRVRLSIVEWKPVTGAVSAARRGDWQAEFAKYKTIPQYERLNRA